MATIASIIHRLIQLVTLVVVIDVVLGYFMSPFHPVRQFLDRIVEPLLRPIRRVLPQTGMIDFSPLVLIILLQVIDLVINNLLLRF
jgi:YggT family protein